MLVPTPTLLESLSLNLGCWHHRILSDSAQGRIRGYRLATAWDVATSRGTSQLAEAALGKLRRAAAAANKLLQQPPACAILL